MTDFLLLNQSRLMHQLRPGMTVHGDCGGQSEVLGHPERLLLDGTTLFCVATEHGTLLQQYNAPLTVSLHGPS